MSSPFADLPSVTAYFEAVQDERADALMRAIGRLVCGANLLETVLLMMVLQLRGDRDGQLPSQEEFAYLEEASAGRRLGLLRELDIPADLEARIDDVIERRNRIVHHIFETPEIVVPALTGEGIEAAVKHVEQVALDCGTIGVELYAVAGPALEAKLGKGPVELIEILGSIDVDSIEDSRFREQLEVVRAMRGVDLTLPWQADGDAGTSPPSSS
jgi:hypothetical protein